MSSSVNSPQAYTFVAGANKRMRQMITPEGIAIPIVVATRSARHGAA